MLTIGRHLIAEFYSCDSAILNDVGRVRQAMLQAAEIIGATVVGDTFHQFTPQGVSGTVVIAESHLSIHTWPERRYVAIDIFTCGGLDPRPGFASLGRALFAGSWRVQEILRGLPEELDAARGDTTVPWQADDVQIVTRVAEEFASATPDIEAGC